MTPVRRCSGDPAAGNPFGLEAPAGLVRARKPGP
jgi:hypothetical protein